MNSQPSYFLASFPELPDYGVRLERLSDDWIAIEMYESYAGTEIGRTAVKVGELSLAIALEIMPVMLCCYLFSLVFERPFL